MKGEPIYGVSFTSFLLKILEKIEPLKAHFDISSIEMVEIE